MGTAILNGFGRTLGEGILGLQALKIAVDDGHLGPGLSLMRADGVPGVVEAMYRYARGFAPVAYVPHLEDMPGAISDTTTGEVLDLRGFLEDPGFRSVSMIDYFLRRLSVPPASIPSARKRNTWLTPRISPVPHPIGDGYILVCPNASIPMRCMPKAIHERILTWLGTHQARPVVSQAMLPQETTFGGLCSLVQSARFIITTDTGITHLADAFSKPCLTFFTTHRPEWRVRDYPFCRPVYLPADLPLSLEFPRGEEDVLAAQAAWMDGLAGGRLESLLTEVFQALSKGPIPYISGT